jgi:hypothetical protein
MPEPGGKKRRMRKPLLRIQEKLCYCSPAAFERKFLTERHMTERFGFNY